MHSTNRRIGRSALSLAAAALTAIALSACGGSVTGNAADDSGGKVSVTVWHQVTGGDQTAKLEELVTTYNDSQDEYVVKLQYAGTTNNTFTSKLINAITNGNGPDLVLNDTNPQALSQIIDTGKVVELGPLLSDGESDIQESNFTDRKSVV